MLNHSTFKNEQITKKWQTWVSVKLKTASEMETHFFPHSLCSGLHSSYFLSLSHRHSELEMHSQCKAEDFQSYTRWKIHPRAVEKRGKKQMTIALVNEQYRVLLRKIMFEHYKSLIQSPPTHCLHSSHVCVSVCLQQRPTGVTVL